jgi:hypothetical protein
MSLIINASQSMKYFPLPSSLIKKRKKKKKKKKGMLYGLAYLA